MGVSWISGSLARVANACSIAAASGSATAELATSGLAAAAGSVQATSIVIGSS